MIDHSLQINDYVTWRGEDGQKKIGQVLDTFRSYTADGLTAYIRTKEIEDGGENDTFLPSDILTKLTEHEVFEFLLST